MPPKTSGPAIGDPVSRAAGYLGLAVRYGGDVEAARQVFHVAKLEKQIRTVAPTLSVEQRESLISLLQA